MGRYFGGNIPPAPIKVAQNLFDELVRRKSDVTFIEYFLDGRLYGLFTKLFGKEELASDAGGKILRLGIIRLFLLLVKSGPDIVHVINFERFPLIAFLLKPFIRYKIYYSIHGIFKHERALNNIKLRLSYLLKENFSNYIYYSFSDKLFFLSEGSVNIASRYYKLERERIKVIANGISPVFSKVYEARNKVEHSGRRIVFVGDYGRKEKGLEFLLSVLGKIEPESELFVVGSGYEGNSIVTENKKINISVIERMSEEELAEFYLDKDIFISASAHDSFGMAPAEAMAAGLVTLVSAETGMSRYIQNGFNGLIFPSGNAQALTEILKNILPDIPLQKRISAEAAKIYDILAWDKISELYQSIYNES